MDSDTDDEPTSENYLPYAFNDIEEAFKQCGLTSPYENEETRAKALQDVRDILKADSDLDFNDSDNFLLCFIRSRKYHPGMAAAAIKHYYHFLGIHKDMFVKVDEKFLTKFVGSNIIGFLPYRDAKGCALYYALAEKWDTVELPVDDAICAGLVSTKGPLMCNRLNQVAGISVILNLKGFSFLQLYHLSKYLLFFARAIQKCCPCRVKKVHFVNIPYVFSITWKIVNPLISEKIKKRLIFHDSLESLHDQVPQSILPEELGGYLGPFRNEDWTPDFQWMVTMHEQDMKFGYKSVREDTESSGDEEFRQTVEKLM